MDNRHDILSLLRQVAGGETTPEDALLALKQAPFEDLGYAKVDFHRSVRQGAAEVIYGAGKTPEQIAGIAAAMAARHNPLHAPYIQKALAGILGNVTAEGKVMNVSAGTAVMKDRDGYCRIPRTWIQGRGQGLTLAFLAQVLLY